MLPNLLAIDFLIGEPRFSIDNCDHCESSAIGFIHFFFYCQFGMHDMTHHKEVIDWFPRQSSIKILYWLIELYAGDMQWKLVMIFSLLKLIYAFGMQNRLRLENIFDICNEMRCDDGRWTDDMKMIPVGSAEVNEPFRYRNFHKFTKTRIKRGINI